MTTSSRHRDVTALIVTFNNADTIGALIDDLFRQVEAAVHIIVVDNNSSDHTTEVVRSRPGVQLVNTGGNLGYAGAINIGMTRVAADDHLLVLNPDLRVRATAVARLLDQASVGVGVVVPRIIDGEGELYLSIRREPTVTRQLTDAVLGSRMWRPEPFASETVRQPEAYQERHEIDWATGAALLISPCARKLVGSWDERFFLYSEETDFMRRVRDFGLAIRFEPSAEVRHTGSGSGRSAQLDALLVTNKVAYIQKHYGVTAGLGSQLVQMLGLSIRWNEPNRGYILRKLLSGEGSAPTIELLRAIPQSRRRDTIVSGSIIVPAHNEERVIDSLLRGLAPLESTSAIEVIVVCNGCTDQTASVARRHPGVKVRELRTASKTAALQAGDAAATRWPRLYVDADVLLSADAAIETLQLLESGVVLAARPRAVYDTNGSELAVRSYYRARSRMRRLHERLWGAGVYGLSQDGHARIGGFPDVVGDDLWVDRHFRSEEISIVPCDPVTVRTPRSRYALTRTLRRVARGNAQIAQIADFDGVDARRSTKTTMRALIGTIRGPRSLADALVFIAFSLSARLSQPTSNARWERDETTRSSSVAGALKDSGAAQTSSQSHHADSSPPMSLRDPG